MQTQFSTLQLSWSLVALISAMESISRFQDMGIGQMSGKEDSDS
jgi:hypothetical protein